MLNQALRLLHVSRGWIAVASAVAFLLLAPSLAWAWQSSASKTLHRIHNLKNAILQFREHLGRYPDLDELHRELTETGLWLFDEPLNDVWGRPLVFQLPGRHGPIDIHSVGPDGLDEDGAGDDVSLWAGVNDGYHWKSCWPSGRLTIGVGVLLGVGLLLTRYWFPWRVVIPASGIVVSLGVVPGCLLLLHPGHVPDRNVPLGLASAYAAVLLIALVGFLLAEIRKRRGARRNANREP